MIQKSQIKTTQQKSPIRRLIFLGTPDFALPSLQALHHQFEILAVYTQPDRPIGRGQKLAFSSVKKAAIQMGLSVRQPDKISDPQEMDYIRQLQPDCIVVVAYGQILKEDLLALPVWGCVNLHSSLLPRWRGAAPIQWALLSGDEESGVTVQKIVKKLDAGAILAQASTPLSDEETATSLHDRLAVMGSELLVKTLQQWTAGQVQESSQDESKVTYAHKLAKDMQWLKPDLTVIEADRKIRALNPWPGTRLMLEDGRTLRILKARAQPKITRNSGQLFEFSGMLLWGLADGSMEVLELQWDGKKPLTVGEFLNGLKGSGQSLPIRVGFPKNPLQ